MNVDFEAMLKAMPATADLLDHKLPDERQKGRDLLWLTQVTTLISIAESLSNISANLERVCVDLEHGTIKIRSL